MEFIAGPDMKRARQLLIESGYNGAPVVGLLPTDNAIFAKQPEVATQHRCELWKSALTFRWVKM